MVKQYLTIVFFMLLSGMIFGQFDSSNPSGFQQQFVQQQVDPFRDSISIQYFYLTQPDSILIFSDTSLSRFTHAYDPSRLRNDEYFNLGNTGSASRSILFNKEIRMGTDYGFHPYDIYRLSSRGFRFYKVNRPFFDFSFSPVGGQQNFVIKTDFARSFSDGMNLSVNYDRINQEGFYQSQQVLHTNFGLGVWYEAPQGNRSVFITLKNEINTEEHNGGIIDRTEFLNPFAGERMSINVNNDGATSRYQHRSLEVHHYYNFIDSTAQEKGLSLISTLRLGFGYYKYSDDDVASEEAYYGIFFQDSRGVRNYQGYTQINTSHHLQGRILSNLNASVGLDYTFHRLDQEAEILNRNDIFVNGKIDLPLSNRIVLNGNAKLGLGSATGDFLIEGMSSISLSKSINLDASIQLYRNRHPITANHLAINGSEFWNNELAKPFGTNVQGKLTFPWLNLKVGVSQLIENNTLYYGISSTPLISDVAFTATGVNASFDFKLWKFNFNNFIAGQIFNNNLYNLPEYYAKSNVYLEGDIFKRNMKIRLGAEGRLIGPHNQIQYNPLIGEFYQAFNQEELYPFFDFYILARIKQFRFFVRFENAGNFFNNDVYFQIGNYPQFDQKIRLGIKWRLYD